MATFEWSRAKWTALKFIDPKFQNVLDAGAEEGARTPEF
jgi:hypothetical protein